MAKQAKPTHDVFISASPKDHDWVSRELLPQMEQAGLKVIVDSRDFELGAAKIDNFDLAIMRSRNVLLVLTRNWLKDDWSNRVGILAQSEGLERGNIRILPLLVEPCELPPYLAALTYLDLTKPDERKEQVERLVRVLASKTRIFIGCQPTTQPDRRLAERLAKRLEREGHRVYLDDLSNVGRAWAKGIEQEIEASDFFIVFLSETSVRSEMLAKEIECAHDSHIQAGWPSLLPVCVRYDDPLPIRLNSFLDHLIFTKWLGQNATIHAVRKQLLDLMSASMLLSDRRQAIDDDRHDPAVVSTNPSVQGSESEQEQGGNSETRVSKSAPEPVADPVAIGVFSHPGGALRIDSQVYVERVGDVFLRQLLSRSVGTTATIQAPRQTGKSSLLLRNVDFARKQRKNVVLIDFQLIDEREFLNIDTFLYYIARTIVKSLRIDRNLFERIWGDQDGSTSKLTLLMENYILPEIEERGEKVVLAMDEVDILVHKPYRSNVFGMFRAWINHGAINSVWDNLDILMVISTEPYLLISDRNQSPFNVGAMIYLEDFDVDQVSRMNQSYGSPLNAEAIPALVRLLGGHPYLTSLALYILSRRSQSWKQLAAIATEDRGPFGDHLRRYLWMLRDRPELRAALRKLGRERKCDDIEAFHQLSQAGLIKGSHHLSCSWRCELYEQYFTDKLV